jgi:hypothetical protein
MSEPAELTGRVTRLEHEMAEVRFLATKAEKDASDCKAVLHGHAGVLNAIREDQVEQGKRLAKLESEVRSGFADVRSGMRSGFADVYTEMHSGFAEMRRVHTVLAHGQAHITDLLTRQLGEPGDAGE